MLNRFAFIHRVRRSLEAMQYPYPLDFLLLTPTSYRRFVMWLEDTQIRAWAETERGPLRDTKSAFADWWSHYAAYSHSLGYKRSMALPLLKSATLEDGKTQGEVIPWLVRGVTQWLVGKAIRYFYVDEGGVEKFGADHEKYVTAFGRPIGVSEQFRQAEDSAKGKESSHAGLPTIEAPFEVANPESIASEIRQLCQLLKLPTSKDPYADLTLAVRSLKQFLSSHPTSSPSSSSKTATSQSSVGTLLDRLPLGFATTRDPVVDRACRVLRLLYTADLREVQDRIDLALIHLQNMTGDPKTDSRLGKVGS